MSGEKILEGVFGKFDSLLKQDFDLTSSIAVHKPQGVTSADVIRTLQKHFNPSKTFRPWLEEERARRDRESQFQRKRRRHQRLDVKIGHGGTLDPLATGVLITGIGKGTKSLQDFLACTKSYETIVTFGAETDTYDRLGKIVRRAPYEHITREAVEKALEQFRGNIMQKPPIFSALRVNGKKLYEYAREGKVPPIEIKHRPVEVLNMEIVEWYEPGTHEYKWPEEEMTGDEKAVAEKLLDQEASVSVPLAEGEVTTQVPEASSTKRKSPPPADEVKDDSAEDAKKQKVSETDAAPAPEPTAPEPATTEVPAVPAGEPKPQPPAVKIKMTVTSGFYVRSLAHDLGKAVGSCALMSELVRSRQGDYELSPDKVLEYKDLDAGEEVWGPKVEKFLTEWEEKRATKAEAEAAQ
ncbi:tRNA pseudouridine synthase II, TruB [Penicillium italicum]|uniref:tRNA pseudouridine(55) synthase n=1 Tax=Penicillium italicum TaxID=40296 RepID=A0A0A2L2X6_PENIT|nr:tRNA pseudouridine synthase II, TruB [Penicillium italicum]